MKAGPAVLWEPPGAGMPSLVLRGPGVRLEAETSPGGVSEAGAGTSLNPPGTPFEGASDTDILDTYPSELRGVFHVMGRTSEIIVGANLRVSGVLQTDGSVYVGDPLLPLTINASLTAGPRLYSEPPAGYTAADVMVPVAGTWERRPSPERP